MGVNFTDLATTDTVTAATLNNVLDELDAAIASVGGIMRLTNKSGAALAANDCVVIDAGNDEAVDTTTTAGDTTRPAIVTVGGATDAEVTVSVIGEVTVVVDGAGTRGQWIKTSSTAKRVTPTSTLEPGVFGILTSASSGGAGTTASAVLLGTVVPSIGLASDGTVAGATSQAQDFGANGIETDAIADSSGSGITVSDDLNMASGADVYPRGDEAGLGTRRSSFATPTNDYSAFSGFSWDSTDFDGTPSTVDTSSYPSLLYLLDSSSLQDFFAYKSSGSTPDFRVGVAKSANSYIGLRFDDGGNDDYVEVRLVDGTETGLFAIEVHNRTGGGAVATNTYADGLPPDFRVLRLRYTGSTYLAYIGSNSPAVLAVESAAKTITPSRIGLVFGTLATNQSAFADWSVGL